MEHNTRRIVIINASSAQARRTLTNGELGLKLLPAEKTPEPVILKNDLDKAEARRARKEQIRRNGGKR
jgi:hypothetical protein